MLPPISNGLCVIHGEGRVCSIACHPGPSPPCLPPLAISLSPWPITPVSAATCHQLVTLAHHPRVCRHLPSACHPGPSPPCLPPLAISLSPWPITPVSAATCHQLVTLAHHPRVCRHLPSACHPGPSPPCLPPLAISFTLSFRFVQWQVMALLPLDGHTRQFTPTLASSGWPHKTVHTDASCYQKSST